ncbi:flagellar hook-basal body complex protein FliE [Candidatus Contendibacter odensensis]|uniref:Flagellar hook-basal body complex protein FliE n=1 Tax=Candidatus Contendobacter odensis Run_B_J11 TaxID=1400861 RepID=A0A7U7G9G3_9GAMM|nr:flagellar hook-basal body complex protein FliE [Candidatus Contendobacter odensis]CDH44164.1 putative flagellar hook-basal body complex protein [Candidatus Contendobacter odensis Run_B_J11]
MTAVTTTNPPMIGLHGLSDPARTSSPLPGADAPTLAGDDFASVFKSMLADVNQSQQQSTQLAASFERGQNQDLAGVMIAQQKSRLAFQTTLQVRNKLVSAYQDIMNMPV